MLTHFLVTSVTYQHSPNPKGGGSDYACLTSEGKVEGDSLGGRSWGPESFLPEQEASPESPE